MIANTCVLACAHEAAHTKDVLDADQQGVLDWVVWVVLGWNLQHGRDGLERVTGHKAKRISPLLIIKDNSGLQQRRSYLLMLVHNVANHIRNGLADQQDGDIVS